MINNKGILWDDNNKMGRFCDFSSNDIENMYASYDECKSNCTNTTWCTNFTWTGSYGYCYLKNGYASPEEATYYSNPQILCGFVNKTVG